MYNYIINIRIRGSRMTCTPCEERRKKMVAFYNESKEAIARKIAKLTGGDIYIGTSADTYGEPDKSPDTTVGKEQSSGSKDARAANVPD